MDSQLGQQQQRRDVLAFYALTAFAFVMYAVPGEWIPALAPLRLALVTSGLAAGLMVLRRVGRAEAFFFDGVRGTALLVFSMLAVASISWAVNPAEAHFTAVELLKLTAIYFALVNVVTTPRRLRIVVGAMVLGSIVTSIGVIDWYRGGVDLVAACDMRYCTEDAFFSIREIDLGMVADLGTLQRLPRILSQGIVREMAFTGRAVFGPEAERIGLVNKVYGNQEELQKGVDVLAAQIAAKSPLSIRGTKHILNHARDHSVADGLEYMATWNAAMLLSNDLTAPVSGRPCWRWSIFMRS